MLPNTCLMRSQAREIGCRPPVPRSRPGQAHIQRLGLQLAPSSASCSAWRRAFSAGLDGLLGLVDGSGAARLLLVNLRAPRPFISSRRRRARLGREEQRLEQFSRSAGAASGGAQRGVAHQLGQVTGFGNGSRP